jgi:23S rRNA pseudouridine2604 synthase
MPRSTPSRSTSSSPREPRRTRATYQARTLRTTRPASSRPSARPVARVAPRPAPVVAKPTRAVRKIMKAEAAALAPKPDYPMRINKYLALKGYATRKAADEFIGKRRVFINGRLATLGDKVLETDTVELRTSKKTPDAKLVYFVYNKPRDVITHSPGEHEQDIRELLPALTKEHAVFPVGRLDKDSHGLIVLTNDGRITDRLLNPSKEHEKEYVVRTKLKLRGNFKERMEGGVDIEGYMTKPAKVKILGDNTFRITLTEGKKHQIRRMVVALFNEVQDLERVRILNVELGSLKVGAYRPIEGDELEKLMKSLGL